MKKKYSKNEKKIAKILDELNIKYESNKKLVLQKDTKKYRVPDFYLPKYSLAIEYFESWNNIKNKAMEKRERKRFMEKVGAYESSGINCIYLYPDEIIHAKKIIEKKISEFDDSLKNEIVSQVINNKNIKNEENKDEENKEIIKTKKEFTKTIIYPEKKISFEKDFKKITIEENSFLKKFILLCIGLITILFFGLLVVNIVNFLQGNILNNPLIEIIEILFSLFVFVGIVSILASIIFAIQKNLSKGIIIVGIILVFFFILTLMFFGDPFTQIITVLVIALAVVPSEYYMITSN